MKKRITAFTTALIMFFSLIPAGSSVTFADEAAQGSKQTEQTAKKEEKNENKAEDESNKFEKIPVDSFRVSNLSPFIDTESDFTDWWYSEWEDCRYIFLPSTANRNNLIIDYTSDETLYLNDTEIKSGEMTSLLNDADEFNIRAGEKDCGTLKIMQSNLGCIYLNTASGGLDKLDKNRNYVETGSALMLNADGEIEYNGELEKLTSHGNSSWDYSKKKPYNFKLPEKENLYGMGKAKKWILLSNYLDHSMVRNKLTEEMCREAGMDFVMDSVYVDLYADGSYRGTYQLYEKVQIQKNRVNITDLEKETEKINSKDLKEYELKVVGADKPNVYIENSYKYYDIPNDPEDITGGYLLQFFQWNRYTKKTKSGFVTSRGQAIGLSGPEYASKAQVEYIRSFVQDMEDAIYSENGINSKGKHYSDYMDVDSLARLYLVQEISQNIDATFSSFFLWKDSDITGDGKIHFGPAWDFDFTYNNFSNSHINSDGNKGYSAKYDNLYAAYFPIHGYDDGSNGSTCGSGRPTAGISWVGTLYKREEFLRRVVEIYFDSFEPFMKKLTNDEDPYVKKLADMIDPSAEMSNARWHTYGGKPYAVFGSSSGDSYYGSVELLRQYAQKRTNWLSSYWEPYNFLKGDVNGNIKFDILDVILLQKYILSEEGISLKFWRAGDMNSDGILNIIDLCLMKRELLAKASN